MSRIVGGSPFCVPVSSHRTMATGNEEATTAGLSRRWPNIRQRISSYARVNWRTIDPDHEWTKTIKEPQSRWDLAMTQTFVGNAFHL